LGNPDRPKEIDRPTRPIERTAKAAAHRRRWAIKKNASLDLFGGL